MIRNSFGSFKFFCPNLIKFPSRKYSCSADGQTISKNLFFPVIMKRKPSRYKITIVGLGSVGQSTAVGILSAGVSPEVVFFNLNEKRVSGAVLDFQQGLKYLGNVNISGGIDFDLTKESAICIIAAGARRKEKETRIDLYGRNIELFEKIIPKLVEKSPNTILMIITNPTEPLAHDALRMSGLPPQQVIATGTSLDTTRFRYLLSRKYKVNVNSIHGYIIGEHGNSMFPAWSGINISGVRIMDRNPFIGTDKDPDKLNEVIDECVKMGATIGASKGFTNWGVGYNAAAIADTILRNNERIFAISTYAKGLYDVKEDIYLSLPCCLTQHGVAKVINQHLPDKEVELLHKSAKVIDETIKSVKK